MSAASPASVALPNYIDPEAWQGWLDMRKAKKLPATDRTIKIVLNKLADWHNQGYDVNAIIDHNTEVAWRGMFMPRGMQPIGSAVSEQENNNNHYTKETAYANNSSAPTEAIYRDRNPGRVYARPETAHRS